MIVARVSFASPTPVAIAFRDSADPSVAMRIRLNMEIL